MNKVLSFGIAAVLFGICSSSSVEAGQFGIFQPGGVETRDANGNVGSRVCVYENSLYSGWQQCFIPGESIADLKGRNNKISSIRVFGRAVITVYDDTSYRGAEFQLFDDAADLRSRTQGRAGGSRTWDDAIKSFRVDEERGSGDRPGQREPRDSRGQREPRNGICVYENARYQGRSECWSAGESAPDLTQTRRDLNNRVSSIRLFGRGVAELYREVRFRGERLVVDRDIPDLSQLRLTTGRGQGQDRGRGLGQDRGRGRGRGDDRLSWNDEVSSLRVDTGNNGRR